MADAPSSFVHPLPAQELLDRDAQRRSDPAVVPGLLGDSRTAIVELWDGRVRTETADDGAIRLASRAPAPHDLAWYESGGLCVYVGILAATPVVALLRPEETAAGEVSLREVALQLPHSDVAVFQTALALFHWHRGHPRCPRCGAPTRPEQAGWVRVCENEGSLHFPRTDPAVIMAVVDETDRILLARGSRWGGPHRSVLAGFVEPGETFEEAVIRETQEESGVVVDEVQYVGNQPWPFPASLMIGFTARARTHELTPEPGEIEEIAWYTRQDVKAGLAEGSLRLPGRLSIARTLIENWYGGTIDEELA